MKELFKNIFNKVDFKEYKGGFKKVEGCVIDKDESSMYDDCIIQANIGFESIVDKAVKDMSRAYNEKLFYLLNKHGIDISFSNYMDYFPDRLKIVIEESDDLPNGIKEYQRVQRVYLDGKYIFTIVDEQVRYINGIFGTYTMEWDIYDIVEDI